MQQEMSKETRLGRAKGLATRRIQEQMLSCGISPVAGPVLETGRCLEFHRNLQIPMKDHLPPASFARPMEKSFEKDRQAAEEESEQRCAGGLA